MFNLNQLLKIFQAKFLFRSLQNGTTGEKEHSEVDLNFSLSSWKEEGGGRGDGKSRQKQSP